VIGFVVALLVIAAVATVARALVTSRLRANAVTAPLTPAPTSCAARP
jgi:hypothetical protein